MKGGEEHQILYDEASGRYFKATFPGRYGFSMVVVEGGGPLFVDATPLEYLERLELQNRIFGDDIQLEGVVGKQAFQSVVTSQPAIVGGEARLIEIELYFRDLWFRPVVGLNAGHPGSMAFYRDLDEILVLDVHQGNVIKDGEGRILPIDLILVRADDALQSALAPHITQ